MHLGMLRQLLNYKQFTSIHQTRSLQRLSSVFLQTQCSLHTPCRPHRTSFKVIENTVDTSSSQFKENLQRFQDYKLNYEASVKLACSGGGPKSTQRYTEQHGKMLPVDKLHRIIDPGSEFLEIGMLAGLDMEYGNVPRAGCLTGIGLINGVHTVISINDGSVKGGTIFPITLNKQLRVLELVHDSRLPGVYVIDSGGAFLPLQDEIFPERGGRVFYLEARIAALNIPQLAIISGSCTAGGAYLPMMTQECIIVDKLGSMYLGGPPLVYAALGEVVSSEQLGGAMVHSKTSGCTDHFASDEQEAYEMCRQITSTFNVQPVESHNHNSSDGGYTEPLYEGEELCGIIPAVRQHTMDIYQVIARIIDGSEFQEFKTLFSETIVTGFARIQGTLVGIIGNNGEITESSADKATHFIQLCDQRDTPIIFLQNSTPYSSTDMYTAAPSKQNASRAGRLLRAYSRMMSVIACSEVAKITIIVGNSFGQDNYAMCGRSFSPRFMFSWPNAHIAVTDYDHLNQLLEQNGDSTDNVVRQMSALYASQRMWDDGIILPHHTRKVLVQCLSIINQSRYQPASYSRTSDYSVLRM